MAHPNSAAAQCDPPPPLVHCLHCIGADWGVHRPGALVISSTLICHGILVDGSSPDNTDCRCCSRKLCEGLHWLSFVVLVSLVGTRRNYNCPSLLRLESNLCSRRKDEPAHIAAGRWRIRLPLDDCSDWGAVPSARADFTSVAGNS